MKSSFKKIFLVILLLISTSISLPYNNFCLASPPPDTSTSDQTGLSQKITAFNQDRVNICNTLTSWREINDLCTKAIDILSKENALLHINGETIVVGDIHGSLESLNVCIDKFLDSVQDNTSILFLGDYVDRGKNDIECLVLLLKLKITFPDRVFLLRGNHEGYQTNVYYGFWESCQKNFSNIFKEKIKNTSPSSVLKTIDTEQLQPSVNNFASKAFFKLNSVFDYLSIAAVLNNNTLCLHGGIVPNLTSLDQIKSLQKPINIEENELVNNILWADPHPDIGKQHATENCFSVFNFRQFFSFNYTRNTSYLFGIKSFSTFMDDNKLTTLIRGHQYPKTLDPKNCSGVVDHLPDSNLNLLTVFSSANYDNVYNTGAMAVVNDKNQIDLINFKI